jgi:hypothetical protein
MEFNDELRSHDSQPDRVLALDEVGDGEDRLVGLERKQFERPRS